MPRGEQARVTPSSFVGTYLKRRQHANESAPLATVDPLLKQSFKRPGGLRKRRLLAVLSLLVVVCGAAIAAPVLLRDDQMVDSTVLQDFKRVLSFTIFYPQSGSAVSVEKDSYKYDSQAKLFSYRAAYRRQPLVVSMQPVPDEFVDMPESYNTYIQALGQVLSFDSKHGTVHVTQPKNLGGGQAAIISAQGALMFVRSDVALTEGHWRNVFDSLVSEKD